MSTQAIAVERKLTKYFRSSDQTMNGSCHIAMRVCLGSDAPRIFQMLTRPELLETWITLPGDDANCHVVVWQQSGGFRVDHYRNRRRDLIIDGAYRFCRRRKMLFTWRVSGETTGAESLVYVGLHGNFTSTILELHHRGISSTGEYGWQQEMWNGSLYRLSQLFQR